MTITSLTTWWLFCGILVLLMQMGFMLFEAGSVRKINQSGIAIKNLFMLLASILGFLWIGCDLMYGGTFGGLIGNPSIPPELGNDWLFAQVGFAVITATIISGAIAGRTTLRANVISAFIITAFIYPIQGHWIWGGGWLDVKDGLDVHDFAGSGAVHFVGGIAAWMGAWVVGPRWHRSYKFNPDAAKRKRPLWVQVIAGALPKAFKPILDLAARPPTNRYRIARHDPIGPRDLSLASYGIVLLMVGWMGFNGANITKVSEFPSLGKYFLATCLAAVGGMLMVSLLYLGHHLIWPRNQVQNGGGQSFLAHPFATLTGIMGGMVAVTAVCDLLPYPFLGFWIGMAGGLATFIVSKVAVRMNLDDPVDAIAVHAGGGATGIAMACFFPGVEPATQATYLLVVFFCTAIPMFFLFVGLDSIRWLRCTVFEEKTGLKFSPDTAIDLGNLDGAETSPEPTDLDQDERPFEPVGLRPPRSPRVIALRIILIIILAYILYATNAHVPLVRLLGQ